MVDVDEVRAVAQRYKQLTVAELGAYLHVTAAEARRLLNDENIASFLHPTPKKFNGSTILKYAPTYPAVVVIDEDTVLGMWERYEDDGWPISRVAAHYGVQPRVVERELTDLGVTLRGRRPPTRKPRRERQPDPLDPFAGMSADEEIKAKNIMAALAKLAPDFELQGHPRHLAYARSLPHVKAHARARVPMSEHQRYMDKLGGGKWAVIIRADLRAAGLMPR